MAADLDRPGCRVGEPQQQGQQRALPGASVLLAFVQLALVDPALVVRLAVASTSPPTSADEGRAPRRPGTLVTFAWLGTAVG